MFNAPWFFASIVRLASDQAIQARTIGNIEVEDRCAEVLWVGGSVLRNIGFIPEACWVFDQYATLVAMED